MSAWAEFSEVFMHFWRNPVCGSCGTWTCPDCGWQRHGANLAAFQDCQRCGGGSNEDSAFRPTRHHAGSGHYESHNPAAGPACATWHTPPQEPFAGPCAHPSCKTIAWGPW